MNSIFKLRIVFGTLFLTLLALSHQSALAEVKLPAIFGDHMVLQRNKPVRIWGWADAGQKVEVKFADQTVNATADDKGRWLAELAPMKANSKGRDLTASASGASRGRIVKDVLVGEVWICGGQSNMEWTLRSTVDADVELASANYPAIRFIRLPKVARMEPQDDFPVESAKSSQGNWRQCIPSQVENCTGVGYYFARRLHRMLNVPIGLIDNSWGGTMAQHWVTKQTLRPIPQMKPYFEKFETAYKTWKDGGSESGAKKRYEADVDAWKNALEKFRADAKANPNAKRQREPRKPNFNSYTNPGNKGQPGGMYNGCIAPIARFSIRGALFYQGENNSFTVGWKPFHKTFPAVISDWRKAFGDDKLPFGIIQIAGWSNRRSMTYDMNHHTNIVREIQFDTWQRTPGTGLIVTYDTNSNGSIHPGRKLPVGERTARWALAEVYKVKPGGKPLEWQGPVYKSNEIKDGKVVIRFAEGTDRGLRLDQDVDVGFYIAGKDKEFKHARVRVDGGKRQLVVWHDEIKEPVAVRYGWSNLPAGGLMNARELPAYPFRTDTWPLTPHQSTGSYQVEKK